MAHTPGPWEIEYNNSDDASGGEWWTVGPATVHFPYQSSPDLTEQALANARLIARTPIMYEYIHNKAEQGDEGAQEIIATITGR